jgi:hypothetical protein
MVQLLTVAFLLHFLLEGAVGVVGLVAVEKIWPELSVASGATRQVLHLYSLSVISQALLALLARNASNKSLIGTLFTFYHAGALVSTLYNWLVVPNGVLDIASIASHGLMTVIFIAGLTSRPKAKSN